MRVEEFCWIDLAAAIVKQAREDFIEAIMLNDDIEIAYFKRWFSSEWAEMLCIGHGAEIAADTETKTGEMQVVLRRAAKLVNKSIYTGKPYYGSADIRKDLRALGCETFRIEGTDYAKLGDVRRVIDFYKTKRN